MGELDKIRRGSSSIAELGLSLHDTEKNTNKNTNNDESKGLLSRQASVEISSSSASSSSPYCVSRELLASFGMFFMGWYGPKYVFVPVLLGGITQRPIPFQLTSTGDVILDFNLSYPFVPSDKVIISCKYRLYRGVYLIP